jgi:hypothetical protein
MKTFKPWLNPISTLETVLNGFGDVGLLGTLLPMATPFIVEMTLQSLPPQRIIQKLSSHTGTTS